MINHYIAEGRLAKDPIIRQTKSGIKVASFQLIIERKIRDKDDNKVIDGIPCVAWRGAADVVEKYLKKGMLISVMGKLQSRTYQKEGQTHFVVEVHVNDFNFLESKAIVEQRATNQDKEEIPAYRIETGQYDPYNMGTAEDFLGDYEPPF
jgi:single stranded DNA-binding protein (ssb)